MNLIEQLGGYEKTKRELELKEQNSVFQCCTAVDAEMIRSALLQHRREHGIFEVGDWIIIDSYKPEFQFHRLTEDDMGSHWINLVEFKHATDEEIKAGHRL